MHDCIMILFLCHIFVVAIYSVTKSLIVYTRTLKSGHEKFCYGSLIRYQRFRLPYLTTWSLENLATGSEQHSVGADQTVTMCYLISMSHLHVHVFPFSIYMYSI